MKKLILLSLLWGILTMPLHAEIYKWTDSSGNVHFTDEPRPGAEQIELPPAQLFSSPPPPPQKPSPLPELTGDAPKYNIEIIEPKDQATIRNNQGYVSVMLHVTPELQEGDKLQMIFDGKALGEPQPSTVFALKDVNRGSHTLAAKLVNSAGKTVKTSDSITIFMQRPRVGMVPGTAPPRGAP